MFIRCSKKVFVSFESAAHYFTPQKTVVTGTPLREELLKKKTAKQVAKETLGFNSSESLTLILGGSQGSIRINNFILEHLTELIKTTQVLHQTGVANFAEVQQLSRAALIDKSFKNRYQPINYLETNLGLALAAADIVIARAGSGTIFEIAAFGIPAILIPLDGSANGHQRTNAYEFAKGGAAIVIEEQNLLPGIFLEQVRAVLGNPELRSKMSAASGQFFMPEAATKIAQELLTLTAS